MILAERQARIEPEAAAALARDTASRLDAEALQLKAAASSTEAMIAHLKLQIERLRRELYGQRSERTARLIDQMELQLEELEAKATETPYDRLGHRGRGERRSPRDASPATAAFRKRLKPSIALILDLMLRWSCSIMLLRYFDDRNVVLSGNNPSAFISRTAR